IARGQRPGVRALVANAKLETTFGLTAEDVAYRIAPRLNAPGRLGSPDLALALLLETDPTRAEHFAAEVEHAQEQRRTIEKDVLGAAMEQIDEGRYHESAAIVVGGAGWHQGVVG